MLRAIRGSGFVGDAKAPDLAPMLDIVFIMLIFFIVTATFVRESGLEVPEQNQRTESTSKEPPIDVRILAHDRLFVGGREILTASLQSNLQRLHSERPEAILVVRPHTEASTHAIVRVMDTARLVSRALPVQLTQPAP